MYKKSWTIYILTYCLKWVKTSWTYSRYPWSWILWLSYHGGHVGWIRRVDYHLQGLDSNVRLHLQPKLIVCVLRLFNLHHYDHHANIYHYYCHNFYRLLLFNHCLYHIIIIGIMFMFKTQRKFIKLRQFFLKKNYSSLIDGFFLKQPLYGRK